ncbi:NADP-dependent phosphogluconate dehydrogenase [Buchnera aphidicola]|uniref:NADP-dependent phosphogluconate dehydrogenase n=1 Tax=Buchnera aphidicola TaxID=9 RepID=UPI003464C4D1
MKKNDIGVIGMAVMGRNLALNIAKSGYNVAIFNRTINKTKDVMLKCSEKNISPYFLIQDFLRSLKKPRRILLMVQSGQATDDIINVLTPYLNSGDIIIDGGNSFYKDTIRRSKDLLKNNVSFLGVGISGGEYGALNGPSIMPGGQKSAYDIVKPIFKSIASKFKNQPCVAYIGPNGSGHYVKMVHNGIEYADMQLISEVYIILKNIVNYSNKEISDVFDIWNQGELNSYLIDITKNILRKKDHNGDLIDYVLDEAVNKGTGKWTCQDALDLHESLNVITESVFARYVSSLKSQRMLASKILSGPNVSLVSSHKDDFIEDLRKALYLSKIIAYSQGFSQLGSASKKYYWNLKCHEIASIFRSGCIIQADFLNQLVEIYKYDNIIINLLLSPYFQDISKQYQSSLRKIVSYVVKQGIAIPALVSSLTYYDSYRTSQSSANLIQAQRDCFGAHTYKRNDKSGVYHTNWLE